MRPVKFTALPHEDPAVIDEYAATLIWHDGDAHAAIRTLLNDCKHLREQLALAQIAMSTGFTRGWAPDPQGNPD